jgi:hypothetical protein
MQMLSNEALEGMIRTGESERVEFKQSLRGHFGIRVERLLSGVG